jgi:hypothetical protein
MAGNIPSMCLPLFFPLSLSAKMLPNPPHVSDGVIFGLKNAGSRISNGDGKFETVFGLILQFAIFVELVQPSSPIPDRNSKLVVGWNIFGDFAVSYYTAACLAKNAGAKRLPVLHVRMLEDDDPDAYWHKREWGD